MEILYSKLVKIYLIREVKYLRDKYFSDVRKNSLDHISFYFFNLVKEIISLDIRVRPTKEIRSN